jgi:hypothetical protein
MFLRFVCAVVFAAAVTLVHAQPPDARPDRGMLGVLRRDGIMLPFAAFQGNDWSKPWPVPTMTMEVPVTLNAIPNGWWGGQPHARWSAVLAGGAIVPLELKTPIVLPVCEQRRLGIRTGYSSDEPAPAIVVQPYPKDGLAVTPGVRVDPVEIVRPDDPERARFTLALGEAIADAEEKTIRGLRRKTEFDHPIDPAVRSKVVAQLEAWYRAPMDAHGWTLSWIEAAKSYPPGPEDEGCGLETLITGWVQQNAIEKGPRADLMARVTYCDREGATYMLPFGIVRTRARQHWVYQLSGIGQEWYQVMQVSPGRLRPVVEFFGGGGFDCLP